MVFVVVVHQDVTDWTRFDALGADVTHAPEGAISLAWLPSRDHRSAVCIWRVPYLAVLRGWLDAKTAGLCRNTYIEVDEKHAMGLARIAAAGV